MMGIVWGWELDDHEDQGDIDGQGMQLRASAVMCLLYGNGMFEARAGVLGVGGDASKVIDDQLLAF